MQRRNVVGNPLGSTASTAGDESALPPYTDLLWPTLQAVIGLGGSGAIDEIDAAVSERAGLSAAVRAILHGDGPGTEIEYRVAWARTYLKGMGLLANVRRGVWSATDQGRAVRESEIRPMQIAYTAEKRRKRMGRTSSGAQVVLSSQPPRIRNCGANQYWGPSPTYPTTASSGWSRQCFARPGSRRWRPST